jgi:hypothetical protein
LNYPTAGPFDLCFENNRNENTLFGRENRRGAIQGVAVDAFDAYLKSKSKEQSIV